MDSIVLISLLNNDSQVKLKTFNKPVYPDDIQWFKFSSTFCKLHDATVINGIHCNLNFRLKPVVFKHFKTTNKSQT